MLSTVTISVWVLLAIFVLGFVIGWVCRHKGFFGGISISVQKGDKDSGVNPTFTITKQTVHALSLKCQCGETWRFHETSGHPDRGSLPMPVGDSFVCPKCGRTIDLREIRKLENQASASLAGAK